MTSAELTSPSVYDETYLRACSRVLSHNRTHWRRVEGSLHNSSLSSYAFASKLGGHISVFRLLDRNGASAITALMLASLPAAIEAALLECPTPLTAPRAAAPFVKFGQHVMFTERAYSLELKPFIFRLCFLSTLTAYPKQRFSVSKVQLYPKTV